MRCVYDDLYVIELHVSLCRVYSSRVHELENRFDGAVLFCQRESLFAASIAQSGIMSANMIILSMPTNNKYTMNRDAGCEKCDPVCARHGSLSRRACINKSSFTIRGTCYV